MTTTDTTTARTFGTMHDDLLAAGLPELLAYRLVEVLHSAVSDLQENTRSLRRAVVAAQYDADRAMQAMDNDHHMNYLSGVFGSSARDADRLVALREQHLSAVKEALYTVNVALRGVAATVPPYLFDAVLAMRAGTF